MSKWIDMVESALNDFYTETKIPYEFERWDESERGSFPDTYIVYFFVTDPPISSADGKERAHTPKIQVSLYYRQKKTFLTIPDQLIEKITEKGFRRATSRPIPFQQNTGHHGWCSDFIFLEKR